ncbi:MAG: hypothetical protein DVB28_000946 [Verrucomicrobia bacterium]|nr:MAG: hypothetical protein DVB28_000946 [Verrucomicrobiota bacterium]
MKTPLIASCALVALAGTLLAESTLHRPAPNHLLLLDRRVVASASGVELVVGRPQRDDRNPLLPSDGPWENATNNYYPNVAWDASERRWKLWYKDVLADADAIAKMDTPSTVHNVGWYLLYARSADGIKWERPALKLHRFDGNSDNNIVARDCPNAGVFLDEAETEPSRRYKMVYDVGLGKPRVRFSADGIHWSEGPEPIGFKATQGDTHNNAFRDPKTGKFLWFTKTYLGERLVSRLESDDFINWRAGGVVLRSTLAEGRTSQTYALTVFPYANVYLGYLMMYHVADGRKVDCELAWSPDSVHWERVSPGRPLLANGPAGSYDGGCIYAQAGPAVIEEGRNVLYYGGSPTVHLGWKRSGALCRATLPEDGFAGYRAKDGGGGQLVTAWLRPSGKVRVTGEGDYSFTEEAGASGMVRLRVRVKAGAVVYAIHGLELADETLQAEEVAHFELGPVRTGSVRLGFESLLEQWKGADLMEATLGGGAVTVTRKPGLRPFAFGTIFAGDWTQHFGGKGVRLSARLRTPKPGATVRFEIFAKDVSQWYRETPERSGGDFANFSVDADFGWTDAEARAAGWVRSEQAFGWRETLQNAGRVVVMPSGEFKEDRFDLSEVCVEAVGADRK